MSERKSISRGFALRLDGLRGSLGGMAARGLIALTAFGVGCPIAESTAAAADAAALTLGGFLLARAVAVRFGSNGPSKALVELRRVRVGPCDIVDRNHR